MYEFVVFLHILGAFGFLIGHGASAGATFRMPHETDMDRIRALLDLSETFGGICGDFHFAIARW